MRSATTSSVPEIGRPNTSQSAKVMRTPPSRSSMPAVSMFGGVPMRVASPPIEAPYATISRRADSNRDGGRSSPPPRGWSAPAAMGVSRAAVAVFESTDDTAAAAVPNPASSPPGERANTRRPSSARATRPSSP